jgi:hypothetical protein
VRIVGDLPFTGRVVWLTPEQGGRSSGPPATEPSQDYAATAFVPPYSIDDGLASFVLRVSDRGAWQSLATATWLIVPNQDAQRLQPGSVVVVTEGTRPVAYFHVTDVAERP